MNPTSTDRPWNLAAPIVALVVAVVGATALFYMDFRPKNDVQASGVTMTTAAAVGRVGAIALPSEPITRLESSTVAKLH